MYDPTISTIANAMHTERLAQAAQHYALTEATGATARVSRFSSVTTRLRVAGRASGATLKGYREAFAAMLRTLANRIAPPASERA